MLVLQRLLLPIGVAGLVACAGGAETGVPGEGGVDPTGWPAPQLAEGYLVGVVAGAGAVALQSCALPDDYLADACSPWEGDEVSVSAVAPEGEYVLAVHVLSGAGLPLPPGGGLSGYSRVFGIDTPLAEADVLSLEVTVQVGPLSDIDRLVVYRLASDEPPEGSRFPTNLQWEDAGARLDADTGRLTFDVDASGVWMVAAPSTNDPADPTVPVFSGEAGTHGAFFAHGGRSRWASLTVPEVDPGAGLPLVVVLHGSGQDAAVVEGWGWPSLAEQEGFALLTAEGTWAGDEPLGGSFLWTGRVDYDDGVNPGFSENLDYISALLDGAGAAVAVDPGAVFASGFSGGGVLTHRIGAELADRFAGIAPVAALGISDDEDWPHSPPTGDMVSVVSVMGLLDASHPYDGDETRMSAAEGMQAWGERLGCTGEPSEESADAVSRHTWDCGDDAVTLISVADGTHTFTMLDPHGTTTSEAIYAFFAAHMD